MGSALRFVILPAIVLLLAPLWAACGDDDDAANRTDIPQVDAVIEVIEAGDREALGDLIQFTSLPCTEQPGAAPRCRDEPSGTTVDVFQANECENGWVRREGLAPLLDEVMALNPKTYAAFETPEAFYLQGAYAVVFEGDETRVDEAGLKRYLSVGIEGDSGLVTGIALGCGVDEPVHFLLPHQEPPFEDYLVEPPD